MTRMGKSKKAWKEVTEAVNKVSFSVETAIEEVKRK